ncbi:unnamed protein product [Psylliodes chrysocephalus]|uniref:Uncharacterized protein n=1 Tax=Psylliodes chrysocephalus TaxID=3402493 RepID=A0A9P0CU39_9CUCU|nr:unnamed protein product [Psylliodes chrysocephala]
MFLRRLVKLETIQNKIFDNFLKNTQKRNFRKFSTSYHYDLPRQNIKQICAISQDIVNDINKINLCTDFSDFKTRMINLMEYPSKVGNLEPIHTLLMAYKVLEKTENLTDEKLKLAHWLGCLTEMIQGALFMQRDAIDNTTTRSNTKTWHTDTTYCFQTPNDAVLLEHSIFILLKTHFSKHRNYIKILDLFHQTFYDSLQGHNLELVNKTVENFDMNLLKNIAKYKIASNSCSLPVISAWYLTDDQKLREFMEVENILIDIGLFKKVEADYLDSFDKSPINLNTRLGLCSWLAIKSLEKGSGNQKRVLLEHYGKPDHVSINRINNLYRDLNMPAEFEDFKNENYEYVNKKIEKIKDELMKKCLSKVANSFFRLKPVNFI